MHTVREWIDTLPEPHRTHALENIKYVWGEQAEWFLNRNYISIEVMLVSAFVFSDTPQGHEYWFQLITDLEQPQTAQHKCSDYNSSETSAGMLSSER